MSQDVRNNRIALKPLPGEIPNQPWSMESAADRLMDDVFSDVDVMLKSGGETPTESPKQEFVSLQEIKVPPLNMPPTMQPRPTKAAEAGESDKPEKPQKSGKSFEKLLLVAACASLGITLLLWLASQGRLNWLFGMNSSSNPAATKSAPPEEQRFIDYMQRSLDAIEQKSQERQQAAVPQTQRGAAANAPVPVPFPGSLPAVSARPTVLERVYIPVSPRVPSFYINPAAPSAAKPAPAAAVTPTTRPAAPKPAARPTPATAKPAASAPSPKPTTVATRPASSPKPTTVATRPASSPKPTTAASPSASSPKPTTAASPSASSPKPTTAATRPAASPKPTTAAARPTLPVPAPPSAPAPAAQPRVRQQQSTQASASQPSIRAVLRGVLKSEDNSKDAALFEVNGSTNRFTVGEPIGGGWTLVEVTDREAVIRRNGEVRSVYVGQEF